MSYDISHCLKLSCYINCCSKSLYNNLESCSARHTYVKVTSKIPLGISKLRIILHKMSTSDSYLPNHATANLAIRQIFSKK